MAAKQSVGAPAGSPPPLPPPPPVPVSGINPQRKAIAPELTPEPKGANPAADFAKRQRESMAKHGAQGQVMLDAAAEEDAAPPPKAKPAATAAEPGTSGKTQTAGNATAPGKSTPAGSSNASKIAVASATDGKPENGAADGKAAESSSETSETRERYDLQSLKRWLEKKPEDAAALRKLFDLPADTNSEWIRLKNKERKIRDGIHAERETTVSAARAEREAAEAAKTAMDGAVVKLNPIADLWEAVREPIEADPQNPKIDFEAADAAFLANTGISIDDYMRSRARRSIASTPDAVRLRVENAKLKRELAGKPSDKQPAAGTPAKEESAGTAVPAVKPKRETKDWTGELASKHKLRQIEGWNELLDAEMRRFHDPDTDDYSEDPDAAADRILKRQIEALSEEEAPETPAPKTRTRAAAPAPRPAPKNGKHAEVPAAEDLRPRMSSPGDDDEDVKVGGMTWSQRQARALKRAQQRARGELE